jgi:hypothetical protein
MRLGRKGENRDNEPFPTPALRLAMNKNFLFPSNIVDKAIPQSNEKQRQPGFTELPLIKSGERNTKNLVIMVLAGEWPLSVQDICNTIHENYDSKVTYQGVRKAILQLESQEILTKEPTGYKISPKWAESAYDFYAELRENAKPTSGIGLTRMPAYYSRTYEFDGPVSDAYHWAVKLHLKAFTEAPADKKNSTCIHVHMLPPILLKPEEFEIVKGFSEKGNHYVATPSKTKVDQVFLDVFSQFGVKSKAGCKVPGGCDCFVIGDYLIEIHCPDKMRKEVDKAYKKADKVDEKLLATIQKMYMSDRYKTKVVITNNPEAAEKVRKKIIAEVKAR